LDEEFKDMSTRLIDKIKKGEMIAAISELTLAELEGAPEAVKDILDEISPEYVEYLDFTEEAFNLAQKYITDGVIGAGKLVDAQHIAIATVHRVDVLVSWNFKHIVNLTRIRGYNSVNLRYGYQLLEIRAPYEVLSYEE
jgi:hypothetical protein